MAHHELQYRIFIASLKTISKTINVTSSSCQFPVCDSVCKSGIWMNKLLFVFEDTHLAHISKSIFLCYPVHRLKVPSYFYRPVVCVNRCMTKLEESSHPESDKTHHYCLFLCVISPWPGVSRAVPALCSAADASHCGTPLSQRRRLHSMFCRMGRKDVCRLNLWRLDSSTDNMRISNYSNMEAEDQLLLVL